MRSRYRQKHIAGLPALAVALVLASANLTAQTSYEEKSAALALLEPPVTVFTFSGARGTVLTAERGTRVYVPPYALRYADGREDHEESVRETVVLRLTERLEALDFAGMPPGTVYPDGALLIPSGMLELRAVTEGGRPLELAPNTQLSVFLPEVRADSVTGGNAVYHFRASEGWHRRSDAGIHRSGARASDDADRPPVRGVREFQVNALGAWMIGRPAEAPTTCLEGRVHRRAGSPGAGEGNQVHAVNVEGRGAFQAEFRGDRFRVESFRDEHVKLVVLSEDGFAGVSAEFLPAKLTRNGSRQNGACRDAGVVRLEVVPDDARYDRTAFRETLGFSEPLYGVAYPPPPNGFDATKGLWPPQGLASGSDLLFFVITVALSAASGLK